MKFKYKTWKIVPCYPKELFILLFYFYEYAINIACTQNFYYQKKMYYLLSFFNINYISKVV